MISYQGQAKCKKLESFFGKVEQEKKEAVEKEIL